MKRYIGRKDPECMTDMEIEKEKQTMWDDWWNGTMSEAQHEKTIPRFEALTIEKKKRLKADTWTFPSI